MASYFNRSTYALLCSTLHYTVRCCCCRCRRCRRPSHRTLSFSLVPMPFRFYFHCMQQEQERFEKGTKQPNNRHEQRDTLCTSHYAKHSLCVNCTHQTEHYSICISSLLRFGVLCSAFRKGVIYTQFCSNSSTYSVCVFYILTTNDNDQPKPARLLSKSFSRRTLKVIVLLCVLFPCKIKYNRRYLVTK